MFQFNFLFFENPKLVVVNKLIYFVYNKVLITLSLINTNIWIQILNNNHSIRQMFKHMFWELNKQSFN